MVRKIYTKEFKIKALELLEQSNKTLRQVAKELGVAENNLYNWPGTKDRAVNRHFKAVF